MEHKNSKRLLSLLLTMLMVVSMFPSAAFAADEETVEEPAAAEEVIEAPAPEEEIDEETETPEEAVTPVTLSTQAEEPEEVTEQIQEEAEELAPVMTLAVEPTDVAQIGEQGYATLAGAIEAAKSGDTIKLLSGVNAINLSGVNLTIDLNGKNIEDSNYAIAISNSTLNIVGSGSIISNENNAIFVGSGSGLTIGDNISVNGIYSGCYGIYTEGTVTINGGTFDGSSGSVFSAGSCTINGGTFSSSLEGTGYTIIGGTYSSDPSNYVDKTKYTVTNDGTTWTVQQAKTYVAQIGDTKYETLAQAIAACTDGYKTEIDLIGNIEYVEYTAYDSGKYYAAVQIPAEKQIVLDLNGCIISGTSSTKAETYLIQNLGNLTITDDTADKNGKITYAYTGEAPGYGFGTCTVKNNGTMTVKAGTIENTSNVDQSVDYALDSSTANGIDTSLTIEGGTFIAPNTNAVIRYFVNYGSTGNMTISGGTFTGGSRGRVIYIQDSTNTKFSSSYSNGSISITGGTFTSVTGKPVIKVERDADNTDSKNLTFSISGGYFNSDNGLIVFEPNVDTASEYKTVTPVISGGYFTEAEKIDAGLYTESGKDVVENTDETTKTTYPWTIGQAKNYVAQIGDSQFETLTAAVAYAKANSATEITLLSDIEITDTEILGNDAKSSYTTTDNTAWTTLTKISGVKNAEAETADEKYYTITVTGSGKLVMDYFNEKTPVTFDVNIIDNTTEGNGLYLRDYNNYYPFTYNGNMKIGSASTMYDPIYYGNVEAYNLNDSMAEYHGTVTINGDGTISAGKFYNFDTYSYLASKLASGKILLYNGTYLSVGTSSSATLKKANGDIYNCSNASSALSYAAAGETVTMTTVYYSVLSLPTGVILIVPSNVAYSRTVSAKDSAYTVETTTDDDGNKIYTTSRLTSGAASITKDGETYYYSTLAQALAAAADGNQVDMQAESSSNVTLKKGITLNTNGYAIGSISSADPTCKVVQNENIYSLQVLTAEDAEAVAQNGSTYYSSLASAISAASSDDEVVLLKDSAENVSLPASVTLKVNGTNFTGTVSVSSGEYKIVTAGEGTERVFSVAAITEEEAVASVVDRGVTHYFDTLQHAITAYQGYSGYTIKLLKDITVSDSDCYSSSVILGSCNANIDGSYEEGGVTKSHSITYTSEATRSVFDRLNGATIKNIDFKGMTSQITNYSTNATYENIDVYGSFSVKGNGAVYIYNACGKETFKNCTSYVEMTGQGGQYDYNAIFVGYAQNSCTETLTFENCVNAGSLVCGKAAMFLANPASYSTVTMNVTNCSNNGTLISTYVDSSYNMNYYVAVNSNSQTLKLNNTDYAISGTLDNLTNVGSDTLVTNNNKGFVYNGPVTTGMQLTVNKDGTYTIIPATDNKINDIDVDHYLVGSGLYVGIAGGSSRFYATETINSTGANGYISTLKDLKFVDSAFVNGETTSALAGNTTFTKDGVTYYVVKDNENTGGIAQAATAYFLSAYDADGNLLASVTSAGETAVEYVAKIGDNCYTNLADAVAAAQDGETITLLKDQSSTRITLDGTKNIKIDLNGKELSAAGSEWCLFSINNGNTLTIDGTTEGSKVIGTTMFASDAIGSLVINGGTYTGVDFAPFYTNGTSGDNVNITINDATIISPNKYTDANETYYGIYLAGNNKTVLNNCTITGDWTGVEVRAGDVTFNNCTVTGKATEYSCTANGNGPTTKGAAIAIAQHTTKKDISVTVNGGTYTGVKAISEFNPQDNDPAPQVTMSVIGGQFKGDVVLTDTSKCLSGGIYSDTPNTAYVAAGKSVITNTDSATRAVYPFAIGVKTGDIEIKSEDKTSGTSEVKVNVDTTVDYSVQESKIEIPEEVQEKIETNTVVEGVELEPEAKVTYGTETVNGVQAVVNAAKYQAEEDKNTSFTKAVADSTATNTTVTVKVDVQVTPVSYNSNETEGIANNTIKFELTPVATVTIKNGDAAEVTQKVEVTNEMIDTDKNIVVSLYTGFAPKMLIHRGDDGSVIDTYYPVDTATDGQKTFTYDSATGVCTAVVHHFSSMEAVEESTSVVTVAKIGTTEYESLAAAVAAVADGGTITLLANNSEAITVGTAKSFTIDPNDKTYSADNIKAGDGYSKSVNGNTFTFAEITYTVSVQSRINGTEDTVANVSGGGIIGAATGTTVSAPNQAGYTFLGWYSGYLKTDIGTLVSSEHTFTYKPTAEITLTAVYEKKTGATFSLTVDGSKFKITGNKATQYGFQTYSFNASDEITVEYVDSGYTFLYWSNASNKVVSKSKSYTFTLGSDTNLHAVCADESGTGYQALVVFLSAYDQIMSARNYTTDDTIDFPSSPAKMGCTFDNWVIGDTTKEATEEAIKAAIPSGTVIVKPDYIATGDTYRISITYKHSGTTAEQTGYEDIPAGEAKTVTAADTYDSEDFSYWTDSDGTILSYDKSYLVRTTTGTVALIAVYGDSTAEKTATCNITSVTRGMKGAKYMLSFTESYYLPSDCTIVKTGFIMTLNKDTAEGENTFELDKANVENHISNLTALTGVYTDNLTTTDSELVVYMKGYVQYRDANDALQTLYSSMSSASYNSLTN